MKTQQTIIKVCAWHEMGAGMLPSFAATHGICPVCLWLEMPETAIKMKREMPEWPSMIREGGWVLVPSNGYWPILRKSTTDASGLPLLWEVRHEESQLTFALSRNGAVVMFGDLSECLGAAS